MSGSGGFGGYEVPTRAKFDCASGIINTTVSSVDLEVLTLQSSGDILEVELSDNRVILVDINGQTLGVIMHTNTMDLIECIKKGNTYNARIINISGPLCSVIIKRI